MMEIISYIYKNYTYMIEFFETRYGVNKNQANNIIEVLLKCLARDEFYEDETMETVQSIFVDENVRSLYNFFATVGITKEEMKEVIVQIPEILFYLNRLENVYVIYKDDEFKGYVLLNGEKYQAYRLTPPSRALVEDSEEDIINQWRIGTIPDQIHVVDNHSYSRMLEKTLFQIKTRPDLRKEYGIRDNATTEEIFEALTKRYRTNDLYLKTGPKKQ